MSAPFNLAQSFNEALALQRQGRLREAEKIYARVLKAAPDHFDALNLLGAVKAQQGQIGEAQRLFATAVKINPNVAGAWANLGQALHALKRSDEALQSLDKARSLAPDDINVLHQRANVLLSAGRTEDALGESERPLAATPQHAGAWLHRGRALAALKRIDEALASYGKAGALRKNDPDVEFSEALVLLARGDYRSGFAKYEARWRRTGMPALPSRRQPLWLGEYPLGGKTVLLHAEQGFGDIIQFARYVPRLAASGAKKIVLEVQSELTALMTRLDGGASVIARGEAPPPFDVHCPLGSLPLAMGTDVANVPAPIPYLSADEGALAKWSARLGPLERPRVALAWSGNASHDNDRNRSLPFARLASLLALPARFISVQRDLRSEDAERLAGEPRVIHLGDELESFTDTAAVLALSDLVISADTAVAHLAGAMGRPLWVLIPFVPDWRWTLNGETSPWYPAARLFRQTALGDWDGVIARVAEQLGRIAPAA